MPRKPRQTSLAPRGHVDGDHVPRTYMGVPVEADTLVVTGSCRIDLDTAEQLLTATPDEPIALTVDGRGVSSVFRIKRRNAREDEEADDDGKVLYAEHQVTFHGKDIALDGQAIATPDPAPGSTDPPSDPDNDEPST